METDHRDSTIQSFANNILRLGNECRALDDENKRLKAEVERLRKAGDMCDQLLACFEMEGRRGVNVGRDMWRAAKEGKPSV